MRHFTYLYKERDAREGRMIELGDTVMDRVTGFVGVAVSRTEYMNGCIRYAVQPVCDPDKKSEMPKIEYVDEQQLVVFKTNLEQGQAAAQVVLESPFVLQPGGARDTIPGIPEPPR